MTMGTTCYDPYHQSRVIHFNDYLLLIIAQLVIAWMLFG